MEKKYSKESASFDGLMDLINQLLGPNGCEWDKSQSRKSMTRYIMEESYELIEAITENNKNGIIEETGDILFQAAFQIGISANEGYFQQEDVFSAIITKLINRHPHIFEQYKQINKEQVESNWHKFKAKNKSEIGSSVLGEIPKVMPSLSTALLLQERAAAFGFDWQEYKQVLAKVVEEIEEIRKAKSIEAQEEELGDLLFSIVNVSRWIGINPEIALEKANRKFKARIDKMEKSAKSHGANLEELNVLEMNELWDKVKFE